ncbi:hypothetical protein [Methylophaga sp.]|uniref:hypothetical protein n=1 Tax=Methylophaga sp. TaxID=2024840 RepID=UPI003F6A15BE
MLGSFLLSACAIKPYSEQAITPIRLNSNVHEAWDTTFRSFVGFPTPELFSVCHDLSCHSISQVHFSTQQWQRVEAIFNPAATSAEMERQQIKQAIALLENIVGKQIGTDVDHAENHLTGSRQGQLDCIDEATNTSVYLRLIETENLLSWHQTASRTSRGPLSGQAPHNTATIIDIAQKQRYAVDAWFGANGEPPAIIYLSDWYQGWRPDKN